MTGIGSPLRAEEVDNPYIEMDFSYNGCGEDGSRCPSVIMTMSFWRTVSGTQPNTNGSIGVTVDQDGWMRMVS